MLGKLQPAELNCRPKLERISATLQSSNYSCIMYADTFDVNSVQLWRREITWRRWRHYGCPDVRHEPRCRRQSALHRYNSPRIAGQKINKTHACVIMMRVLTPRSVCESSGRAAGQTWRSRWLEAVYV